MYVRSIMVSVTNSPVSGRVTNPEMACGLVRLLGGLVKGWRGKVEDGQGLIKRRKKGYIEECKGKRRVWRRKGDEGNGMLRAKFGGDKEGNGKEGDSN